MTHGMTRFTNAKIFSQVGKKIWPHGDDPLIDVGVVELNRNPRNDFAEIEQAAFSPSNIVPGIGFSPDKMLQARICSYA